MEEGSAVKAARCILKIVAALAVIGAAAGLVITYWDKILDAFYTVREKIDEKRAYFCDCDCDCDCECDDFADEEVVEF